VSFRHPYCWKAYDKLLHRCNELEQPGDEEDVEDLKTTRTMFIKAFLLLLVGLTIFTNKNIKNVHLIWLTAMQDLDMVHEWFWGRMTLAFLYTQPSLATDLTISVVGG
jgi:hypothetical protein